MSYPTNGRSGPRFLIARFVCLRAHMLSGRPWNANTVASELEVSTKTVYRDMEFMRDFLGYEFEFNAVARSFTGKVPKPVL